MAKFRQAQSGGVSSGENDVRLQADGVFEELCYLFPAQDHGQLLGGLGQGDLGDAPGLLQGDFVEETEGAGRDDQTTGGKLFLASQVNLIGANVLRSQQFGGSV